MARYIADGRLITAPQVSAAVDFFKKRTPDAAYEAAEFERAVGAGVRFTDEQVKGKVSNRWREWA